MLCYRIPVEVESLARDRKYIIVTIIMLPSHGINMYNNWRLGGIGLGWTWTWLGNRAGLWLQLSRLCRLRTVRCFGFHSQVTYLFVPSIYLLMGAERLVSLLSWVLALSGLAFWVVIYIGLRRSKHHTEGGPVVLGA
jgi:hypothetical protein